MSIENLWAFLEGVIRNLVKLRLLQPDEVETKCATFSQMIQLLIKRCPKLKLILIDLNSAYGHLTWRCIRQSQQKREQLKREWLRAPRSDKQEAKRRLDDYNHAEEVGKAWREHVKRNILQLVHLLRQAGCQAKVQPIVDNAHFRPILKKGLNLQRRSRRGRGRTNRWLDLPAWPAQERQLRDADGATVATVIVAKDEADLEISDELLAYQRDGSVDINDIAVISGDSDLLATASLPFSIFAKQALWPATITLGEDCRAWVSGASANCRRSRLPLRIACIALYSHNHPSDGAPPKELNLEPDAGPGQQAFLAELARQQAIKTAASRQLGRMTSPTKVWTDGRLLANPHLNPHRNDWTSKKDSDAIRALLDNNDRSEKTIQLARTWLEERAGQQEGDKEAKSAKVKPATAAAQRATRAAQSQSTHAVRRVPKALADVFPTVTRQVKDAFTPASSTFRDLLNLFVLVCQLDGGPCEVLSRALFAYLELLDCDSRLWLDFGDGNLVQGVLRQLLQALERDGPIHTELMRSRGMNVTPEYDAVASRHAELDAKRVEHERTRIRLDNTRQRLDEAKPAIAAVATATADYEAALNDQHEAQQDMYKHATNLETCRVISSSFVESSRRAELARSVALESAEYERARAEVRRRTQDAWIQARRLQDTEKLACLAVELKSILPEHQAQEKRAAREFKLAEIKYTAAMAAFKVLEEYNMPPLPSGTVLALYDPMLVQMATSLVTTAKETADPTVAWFATWNARLMMDELDEASPDTITRTDQETFVKECTTPLKLFVLDMDPASPEIDDFKAKTQTRVLSKLHDLASCSASPVTESQATIVANALDKMVAQLGQRIQPADGMTTLRVIIKTEPGRASSYLHWLQDMTCTSTITRKKATNLMHKLFRMDYRPEFIPFDARSTFWLVANAPKMATSLCIWLNHWLGPIFELERAQPVGSTLSTQLAEMSRHSSILLFSRVKAPGALLTVDQSWLEHQDRALKALQMATDTMGQRARGLQSEGAVTTRKQVLAMMTHIFNGHQLLKNQLFTGHWKYDGFVCHFAVYDTGRVYQQAYQQLGFSSTTSAKQAFQKAIQTVTELSLVPKSSSVPVALSSDTIVKTLSKASSSKLTRDGLPSWLPKIGTDKGDAALLALTRTSMARDSHGKRAEITRASQDPKLRNELLQMSPEDRAKLFDGPRAPLNIAFDPGLTFLLGCEAITHDVDGQQVRRFYKLASSAIQSITNKWQSRAARFSSHVLTLAPDASPEQLRTLDSLAKTSLNTRKRAWLRAVEFKAAQQRVVSELLDVSGVSAFEKTGQTMSGARLEVYRDELKYSHLSSTAPRPIALFVGDTLSHPGKGAGVHGAMSGLPILRLLLDELESRDLPFYAFRVDEYKTSKSCPDPDCVGEDGIRSRMLEPSFLETPSTCHRVLECTSCQLKMNRDLVAASNISWAAKHSFVHGCHPWRPRSERELVVRVREILRHELQLDEEEERDEV